jgi:hypothetical protein
MNTKYLFKKRIEGAVLGHECGQKSVVESCKKSHNNNKLLRGLSP